jgi:glycosyltransferase involved in cell wall biosynthesis
MERNHRLFLERWRESLSSHPVSLWQAPSRGRQQVLYIGDIVPAPDRSSGGARLYELLRILARSCDVSYAFLPSSPADEYLRALERIGVHVFRPGYARAVGLEGLDLEAILTSNRFSPVVCALHDVAQRLLPLIRRVSPESAVAIDSYDVHFLREEREGRTAGRRELLERARQTRVAELGVYAKADVVVTVTRSDRAALLAEQPSLDVSIISNIHPLPERHAPREGRGGLLFVGGFSHVPNVDAVLFLCREVLPIARESLPDLVLHVVGNAPPAEILALGGERVVVHGYVADLGYFLDTSLVSVAPLRFGSGMKGKIGEAMAHGLPVVTTPIGAEGMDLGSGHDVLVADDAPGLARAIVQLHEDAALWERLAANARDRVRTSWTPEAVAPGLLSLVRRLAARGTV